MKLSGARGVVLTKLAVTAGLIALIAMVAPVASSATTSRVPGAARSVHASLIRSTAVVRWRPPASDGGSTITRYRAISHPSGLSCTTGGTSCDIAQLKNKTTYRFTVEALNRYGGGPSSSLSNAITVNTATTVVVVPPAPPSPPTTTTTVPSGGGGGGGGGGGSPPPTSYTVTFSANGGSGSMPAETESSSTALTSNGFTNAGYSFSGWNTLANGTGTTYANDATYSFSASITLYAQWTALPDVTVTFNSNGGTGSMSAETENVATALTSNAFARTGYTFAGWSTTANGSLAYANDAMYPFTASVTLYALWAQNFTVTFNANGGTGSMSAETESSPTALTANAFTNVGNTFAGWNTAANGSGTPYANDATYAFTASVTLYAQWTAVVNYTVTFNANGGAGSMSPESDSSPTALTANAFTNVGNTFAGWNTAANGSGAPYANDATYAFTSSVTLYAQWTVGSAPSITLQPNSQAVESGSTASFTASATGNPTPTVQWSVSTNDGSSWSAINGATATTYSVTSAANNGYEYEAVFTNNHGSATTTPAQLTVVTTSTNWSGYVDTGGTFSAVSAKWVVPTVTCNTSGDQYAVQWVGIDGYGSDTVEQDGTTTDCIGTTPYYNAWYEMYGDANVNSGYTVDLSTTTYPVAPGNAMSASVTYAAGEWTLDVADTTAGWTFSIVIATPSPPPAQASAEWIAEDPGVCTPTCAIGSLADFGTVTFTNASVTSNGATGSITSDGVTAIEITDGSNVVMAAPGLLNGAGTSFTDTWESSS